MTCDPDEEAVSGDPGGGRPTSRQVDSIRRAAFHYLERYASSEQNLARVLRRKLKRREISEPDRWTLDPTVSARLIIETVEYCRALGLVNDTVFADARVRSGRRRGLSGARIVAAMTAKGVPRALAEQAVNAGTADDSHAALVFARRRRIGPFAKDDQTPDRLRRDIAAMCRQGFPYALARSVLQMHREQAEALLDPAIQPG
jgi:regulatory protein